MMTSDKYRHFRALAQHEVAETDYQIQTRAAGRTLVVAPHGGGIEPGTSELADAIAGEDHSLYLFEGIKSTRNSDLHITSTAFDEPQCEAMLERADAVLAVHGESSPGFVVSIGGLDTARIDRIRQVLANQGFDVQDAGKPHLAGKARDNVCNRGRTGGGVQLEIAEGLRRTFFRHLSPRAERQHPTAAFERFVLAVREGLRAPARTD